MTAVAVIVMMLLMVRMGQLRVQLQVHICRKQVIASAALNAALPQLR
jgi:hypothetical protein